MPNPSEAILEVFRETGALLEGHFLLSSGLHSPKYLQCALVLQDPSRAERLCGQLARAFTGETIDCVVSPALGGIVVAHELARALGTKAVFAEREDGRMTLRRGFQIEPGQRVLLAEDVITTGGSLREVLAMVKAAGAEVAGVAALVDRTGARDPELGAPLTALVRLDVPIYPPEECPLCDKGLPLVKPGSRPRPAEKGSAE
ncbi:MAG: orotate phosphoribosyltransferase [Phycisphaerae bacterium]